MQPIGILIDRLRSFKRKPLPSWLYPRFYLPFHANFCTTSARRFLQI